MRKTTTGCLGKNPLGFAGAAVYLAAKEADEKVTYRKLAEMTRLTETTLSKRVKKLR